MNNIVEQNDETLLVLRNRGIDNLFVVNNEHQVVKKNENEVLTKTHYGKFLVLNNDLIGSFFINSIHYEMEMIEVVLKNIMSGDTVIDVGANLGTHTIPYAIGVGEKGKVYAFEPQSVIHRLLTENVKMNGFEDRVKVFRNAVGHTNCQTTLNATLGNRQIDYNDTVKRSNFGGLNLGPAGESVKMVSLDSMRDQFPNGVKYIKMDVEGAEPLVILGAKKLITDFRPFVLFEHNARTITPEMIMMYNLSDDVVNFNIFDFFLKELKYNKIKQYEDNFYAIPF